jgi:hypothetical protein
MHNATRQPCGQQREALFMDRAVPRECCKVAAAVAFHCSIRATGPVCALLPAVRLASHVQRVLGWLEYVQAIVADLQGDTTHRGHGSQELCTMYASEYCAM